MKKLTEFMPRTKTNTPNESFWVSSLRIVSVLSLLALLVALLAGAMTPFIHSTSTNLQEGHYRMNSVIAWVGGKRLLRKTIIERIPKHNIYCEPFGGAAWVLFGKSPKEEDWSPGGKQGYREVYNDLNGDLVNFWRYIQRHPAAFATELDRLLSSREIFGEFLQSRPTTDLERAAQFYYRVACSFGSMGTTFAVRGHSSALPLRDPERIAKATERLRNVIIENQDFRRLIPHYDRSYTFFYLDPPYYSCEGFYARDGVEAFREHEALAATLGKVTPAISSASPKIPMENPGGRGATAPGIGGTIAL